MNKNIKSVLGLLLAFVLVASSGFIVEAKGTTSISLSNKTVAVGGTADVAVSASEEGTVTVKYTGGLLSLDSCDADGFSSEGNTITFKGTGANIKFSAKDEGTASIIVSSSSCAGSSATITISGIADPAVAVSGDTDAAENASETDIVQGDVMAISDEEGVAVADAGVGLLNDNGGFTIDGVEYVISEKYSDSEILKGFSKQTVSIAGHTYSEPTNGDTVLLYLKPADNTAGSGEFYLFNSETSSVSKFQYVGTSSNYVVLSEAVAAPSTSMTAAILSTNTCNQVVYTVNGSEFYYFYGVNQDGVEGWYQYDGTFGQLARADIVALSATGVESTSESEDVSSYSPVDSYKLKLEKFRKIISALVVICVLLVFVIINMKFGKGRRNDDEDDGEEEEAGTPIARPSKQMRKSIVFASPDSEDDEEDEEDEEAIEELKPRRNDADSDLDMIDLNDL